MGTRAKPGSPPRWCPPERLETPEQVVTYITSKAKPTADGCLTWTGWTSSGRYPLIQWNKKRWRAQRLLMMLTNPEEYVEKKLVVLSCSNRLCVNPEHLKVMTRPAFNRKLSKDGVLPRGKDRSIMAALGRAPNAKLGLNRVQELVQLRLAGYTYKAIGAKYGVTEQAVYSSFKRWTRMGVI